MDTQDVFQCSRAEATQSLLQMREEKCLTDLDLECEGANGREVISVHSVLFAARSKYFKALCSEPWCTPVHGTRRVTSLVHLPIHIVWTLVNAVYTGLLDIHEENMNELFLACLELDFRAFGACCAEYIQQHTTEQTVCRILETSTRMYHTELIQWCSSFIAERLLSLPIEETFLDQVWQLECFESCVKDNRAVPDVDKFVLCMGWAAYAWEERWSKLTQLLRHGPHGAELSRLCSLACCSEAVRMEVQGIAMFNTVAVPAASQQNEPRPSQQDAWNPASVHVPETLRYQATDMIGGSPGSYGSAMSQHAMGSFALHDDEQFSAACQSAVDELTAWPLAGHSPAQNRAQVLAHGLVAAFGIQECLEAHGLPTHQQPCAGGTIVGRSADAWDMYESHCVHGMSSLDSSMLCETLHESSHIDNCLRRQQPGTNSVKRLGCDFEQGVGCRDHHENAWEEAVCKRGWGDVGMGINEGQSIFVCGGRDQSWRGSTMGLHYCPARDSWSPSGASLRDGVTFASVASLGETVFLFGNSLPPLSSIPNSDTAWKPLPTAPFTTGLQFAAVEAVGDKIFVAGGRSLPNKVHDGCWALDPTRNEWTTCPSLNTARYSAASALFGSQMVVSGGQDKVNVLCTVEGLDAERGWMSLPDLPRSRKYHSMQSVRRRLYCFGGKSFDSRRQTVVEALDPREGQWNVVAHMKEPRSSFGCVSMQGFVFIIGGNDEDALPMSSCQMFDPLMDKWHNCTPLPVESSGLGACVLGAT